MRVSSAATVEVVKFKSTGVAALCIEVSDYIRSGEAAREVDVQSARFVDDIENDCVKVVFDR